MHLFIETFANGMRSAYAQSPEDSVQIQEPTPCFRADAIVIIHDPFMLFIVYI